MQNNASNQERDYAVGIVRRLQSAGFIAYFAGGCVRDQCLGIVPNDYDVATDAIPRQVQELFGRQNTQFVGAAFGVVCVHERIQGVRHQVEVATFRTDGHYSDGRRPDRVTFSDPLQDAQRRDFTINGLFYDPVADQVIDFVGGQHDLQKRVLRAIGDPVQRFTEDKLRLVRAIRIAARFALALEERTEQAMRELAHTLSIVSPERILAEFRKILSTPHRDRAIELLWSTGLLNPVLPELMEDWTQSPEHRQRAIQLIRALDPLSFDPTSCLALWLWPSRDSLRFSLRELADHLKIRWRLSNEEHDGLLYRWESLPSLLAASELPWSRLQRIVVDPRIGDALAMAQAVASIDLAADPQAMAGIQRCQTARLWPREVLDPPPLLTGQDLTQLGLTPGPTFAKLLQSIRDAQLDGHIRDSDQARAWVSRGIGF
jgi:tRNA nucleotidyltransferase/poly(A) polymerase